ncbi:MULTISPECIES: OmpA family protein [unclassified Brevundimonas]|uniref:OmpA family protein n=1 Tax=unclassified Brevundimonas TaxID=2622653 RepID=UPI000E958746|nr:MULTISPECIES: OmpA family protein [unclassified Brevundimonas]MCK6103755.1 OmpA family protein [Brevundimonas sp. EYE_349]HBI18620.1 OmpA family protein [Brevundimonas sp.]
MTGRHAPAMAAALLAAGLAPCTASALTVRLMSGSAIGMKSTFEKVETPRSTFDKAGPDSELQSVFVSSEVAPERVETTRTLLSELNARRSDGVIVIDLPADVLFDFDKATIRPDAEPALARAAELLKSYPRAQVSIGGHTDAKGDDAYNEGLSLRRARAVADRLQGPAGRSLKAEGFGERRPVAPNVRPDGADDPAGRQKNRRVEIRITPQAGG